MTITHDSGGHASPQTIVVVGDVMLDRYLMGEVSRISPEAPVPVLRQISSTTGAGGAANVALNIAAMGGAVRLFGVVGEDQDATALRGILGEAGVSSAGLIACGRLTTTKTRIMSGRQQIARFDNEETSPISSAVEQRLIAEIAQALQSAAVLVLSDYCKGVLTDGLIRELISKAKASGVVVMVDPKRVDFSIYSGADLIKPNRTELAAATGLPTSTTEEVSVALDRLSRSFSGAILLTRAEAGMALVIPGQAVRYFPPLSSLEVADVSGAGDTAAAAIAVALSEGKGLPAATAWAVAASGCSVTRLGAAIVDRRQVESALSNAAAPQIHAGAAVNRSQAVELVTGWRESGDTIVFTNGCFDILHSGHVALLEAAASHGQRLVVGLNTDRSVSVLKGPGRPIQREADRARIIGALRFVDLVVLFDEPTPYELVSELRPDVIVKGADYREEDVVGGDLIRSHGGKVVLVDLVKDVSTTLLLARV